MKILVRRCLVCILMMSVYTTLIAQTNTFERDNIKLEYELRSNEMIYVKSVTNNDGKDIDELMFGNKKVSIQSGQTKSVDIECCNVYINDPYSGSIFIVKKNDIKDWWKEKHPEEIEEQIDKQETKKEETKKVEKKEEKKEQERSVAPVKTEAMNTKEVSKADNAENNAKKTDSEVQSEKDIEDKDSIKNEQTVVNVNIEDNKSESKESNNTEEKPGQKKGSFVMVNIAVIVLVLIGLFVWIILLTKKKKGGRKQDNVQQSPDEGLSPAIVVKKTTSTVLKEQSIENVVNNKAYYKIECSEFCDDSAVKSIYIKNTCIKAIYNMYADDLRNPNNPKEDGCMVLGRWICDEVEKEYYISLEEIVLPGNDAVFKEYELNFGGKIKLRVAEKLRKLRKESNLQYDLTCWVHSHPGLGVFFSNSDSGVQMQLKHPTHPNFLIAIVVDILTPQQEFGIFTFKHDSTINSKNDLKKMYSLEELYKWAIESERFSYKPEDYYNSLSKADRVNDNCRSIMLSNGAIIDISSLVTGRNTGLSGLAYGYELRNNGKTELIINSISKSENDNGDDLLGCFVIGTHCSIPSIRKVITEYSDKVKFVMFYSMTEETVTLIPVINNQMSMDSKYYAEEKLEDLKIWTRRKR